MDLNKSPTTETAPSLAETFVTDEDLLQAFFHECHCKNLRPKSLAFYRDHFKQLRKFAQSIYKPLIRLTGTDIQAFIGTRIAQISPVSINCHLRAFRCLYNWIEIFCERSGLDIGDWRNPMATIRLVRVEKVFKEILTPEEVARILCSFNRKTFCGARNRLMVLLAYDGMLRAGELTNLKIEDVDMPGRTLKVKGKSRSERYVPISNRTARDIHAWMIQFRKRRPGNRFFCCLNGDPMDCDRLRKILYDRKGRLGLKALGPHLLRHSGATQYTANGGSLTVLQHILGHTDIRTTQMYQHPDNRRITEEHNQFSPTVALPIGA